MSEKLKIGVVGAGHLGKIHIKCIQQIEQYELVGFADADEANAKNVSTSLNVPHIESLDELIESVDVIDIVTPTVTHHKIAKKAILANKHVFIEKPITQTVSEANDLMALSKQQSVKVQVGHVERFNPAFLALKGVELSPMFIDVDRLALFNPRGTDVSVVLDLMIHDLDIILHIVKSPVKSIHTSGVTVVSTTPDICNARIEFENGCVANLTASRISLKNMRKIRLFQNDAYISLDFLEKQAQVVRMFDEGDERIDPNNPGLHLDTATGKKHILVDMPTIQPINAIKTELELLHKSIVDDLPTMVTAEDGFRALDLAHKINEQIKGRAL